jgi:hypothetical protein
MIPAGHPVQLLYQLALASTVRALAVAPSALNYDSRWEK